MPCDITFHSNMKNMKNPHMAVSFSDLVLLVSPAIIEVLTGVASGMSMPDVSLFFI